METRANYVLIGAFALAVVLAGFLFVLWLANYDVDRRFATYDILFEDAVTGLSVGGDVYYQGIVVGTVQSMELDEDDPSRVRVRVDLDARTPVLETTKAKLEFFGITGVAYVALETPEAVPGVTAQPLTAKDDDPFPVIATEPSAFQKLFEGAPDLVTQAQKLLAQAESLLSEENADAITKILLNVEQITASIAESGDDFEVVMANLNEISTDVARTTKTVDRMASNIDDLIATDAKGVISEAEGTLTAYRELGESLNAVVKDNRVAVNDFAQQGLAQLARFVTEARQLVASLDRVVNRAESDPARFFFGTQGAEYEPD